MRMLQSAAVAAALAASPLLAQKPATTIQQDFDAATALDAKGDRQAALAAWEALEARTAGNKRNHAIMLVRKSAALFELDRSDEAVAAARAGLADLPAGDATLREDRFNAYLNLGLIAERALDYASALDAYREAEAVADASPDKAAALLRLATTATYVDPAVATAALARADALLAGIQVDRKVTAEFERRKGLVLLNTGDFAGARAKLGDAVKLLGGLTGMTDLRDVSARSDTAIAALLLGDSDTARRYMAFTGAGHLPDGTFDPAVQMKAPDCGGEGGLKPNDMAIIEFSIGDDGTVKLSAPVYAAGGGAVALEFARAALGWSWTPEQVKKLPVFFRYNIRVEMRCSTAFERPSVNAVLYSALEDWLNGKHVGVAPSEGSDAQALSRQRADLAAVEAKQGAQSLSALPALYRLMRNSVVPREQKSEIARRALEIAGANGVPALPRLAIDLELRSSARADQRRGGGFVRDALPLLLDPRYAADPEARSAIRLLIADAELRRARSHARDLLRQVADDPALQKNDSMRVGALVRIASLEQQDGDAAAARAAFDQSGLSSRQCALVDSAPRLKHFGGGSNDFPREAQLWGFEGWVVTQFDVTADGNVQNARAILSYPPFIFSAASAKIISASRYEKTYRPDGGLGCGGSEHRTRFLIQF